MNEEKTVYTTPELTVHGEMAEITQQNSLLNFQDLLGVPPPVVGSEFAP